MESHTVSPQQHGVPHKNAQRKASPMLIKAVIASIIVIVGAAIAIAALAASRSNSPAGDRYQAVFLNSSNSQVFFGKLKNTSGEYLVLENAYYSKASEVPENAATSNNVSLVKVGDEVYGPENVLKIRSEQVLFWQDLKSDSKVAKAIDSAK
jgi:hypothetical protein